MSITNIVNFVTSQATAPVATATTAASFDTWLKSNKDINPDLISALTGAGTILISIKGVITELNPLWGIAR